MRWVKRRARDEKTGKIIHSRKPQGLHDRLNEWLDPYLDGFGKLELFATIPNENWTCLGHELSGKDINEDLKFLYFCNDLVEFESKTPFDLDLLKTIDEKSKQKLIFHLFVNFFPKTACGKCIY